VIGIVIEQRRYLQKQDLFVKSSFEISLDWFIKYN